jgi:cytohesin
MRDAIGEKGMKGSVKELTPKQAAMRGCLGTLKSLHRRGRMTFDKDLCIAEAAGGQLTVLKWLLENACPVDEATDDGATPLYQAAQNGHAAVVWAPTKSDADINKASVGGMTPLYTAAGSGHDAVVRALVGAGVDINKAIDDGSTPLYFAAEFNHETVARALMEAGADVKKADDIGATPLFIAAGDGHETVARTLIQAGADVNKAADDGSTPLSLSMKPINNIAQGKHAVIVQILRDSGAA